MEQDQYVKVNIKESTRTKLKEQARTKGMTLADYIEWLGANVSAAPIADEADALLEQLDAQYEKQNEPTVEAIDTSEWVAGVAPECCCDFYYNYNYNHRSEPCEHWKRVRWTDRNGNSKVNWYNDLINKFDFADDWKIAMKEYID